MTASIHAITPIPLPGVFLSANVHGELRNYIIPETFYGILGWNADKNEGHRTWITSEIRYDPKTKKRWLYHYVGTGPKPKGKGCSVFMKESGNKPYTKVSTRGKPEQFNMVECYSETLRGKDGIRILLPHYFTIRNDIPMRPTTSGFTSTSGTTDFNYEKLQLLLEEEFSKTNRKLAYATVVNLANSAVDVVKDFLDHAGGTRED